jgi:hypothetical protein
MNELSVDAVPPTCKKCERGVTYKKPHHPTCPESNFYKKNSHRFTSHTPTSVWVATNNNNNKKLAPFTRADGDAFFEPTGVVANGPTVGASPTVIVPTVGDIGDTTRRHRHQKVPTKQPQAPELDNPDFLSPKTLKEEIQKQVKSPSYLMKRSKSCPLPVAAIVEYLLALTSFRYKEGTNAVMANDTRSKGIKRLDWYRKYFPPGTIGFTVPKDDCRLAPDPLYSTLEGCTIYVVSWELNVPDIFLPCCDTKCDGELIRRGYDYKTHGYLTPIFEANGGTSWAVSMQSECNKCCAHCKGNDGRMLQALPSHYSMAYPVDPKFCCQWKAGAFIKAAFSYGSKVYGHTW